MPEILPNSNFKNILFFMVVDLCVDNHFAESPHCLLTNISRDNYSRQPLGIKLKNLRQLDQNLFYSKVDISNTF
jgi:hypothetical protein